MSASVPPVASSRRSCDTPAAVTGLEAIEPEEDFRGVAAAKAEKSSGRIRATAGDGMALAFEDRSFDAVVFGLVLCSVPSVERVVAEAFRVLRPGGAFRALEHVRSERAVGGALMDLMNPFWLKLNKQGCNWNRNPVAVIRKARGRSRYGDPGIACERHTTDRSGRSRRSPARSAR